MFQWGFAMKRVLWMLCVLIHADVGFCVIPKWEWKGDCEVRVNLKSLTFCEAEEFSGTNCWYDLNYVFSVTNISRRAIDVRGMDVRKMMYNLGLFTVPNGKNIPMKSELIILKPSPLLTGWVYPGKRTLFETSGKYRFESPLKECVVEYELKRCEGFTKWRASGHGLVELKRKPVRVMRGEIKQGRKY